MTLRPSTPKMLWQDELIDIGKSIKISDIAKAREIPSKRLGFGTEVVSGFSLSVSVLGFGSQFRIRTWLVSDQAAASFGSGPGQFQVSQTLQTTNYGHPVVPPKSLS